MFTIKSVSNEGEYYLVNGWQKAKTFWKHGSEMKHKDLFTREQDAKASLTKLLKVMDEYLDDDFYLIETDENDKIISEKKYNVR